jgi:hypothetical protein
VICIINGDESVVDDEENIELMAVFGKHGLGLEEGFDMRTNVQLYNCASAQVRAVIDGHLLPSYYSSLSCTQSHYAG